MFENKYPYTDFHELNLDWFLAEFKKVYVHVDDLDATVKQFTDFVTNYFNNLDVQVEINNKLDAMAADGSLSALIQPLFDEYKADIDEIVDDQNSTINTQNSRIATLEGRMDTFAHLTDGSTTGDAELADIRVEVDGKTAANAGDAVRQQINNVVSGIELESECYGIIKSVNWKVGNQNSAVGQAAGVNTGFNNRAALDETLQINRDLTFIAPAGYKIKLVFVDDNDIITDNILLNSTRPVNVVPANVKFRIGIEKDVLEVVTNIYEYIFNCKILSVNGEMTKKSYANIEGLQKGYNKYFNFEYGGINSSGAKSNVTNSIRTITTVKFDSDTVIQCTDLSYCFAIYYYNAYGIISDNYTGYSGTHRGTLIIPKNTYCVITIRKFDNSSFLPDDALSKVYIWADIYKELKSSCSMLKFAPAGNAKRKIVSHTGCTLNAPENTIPSFMAAATGGAWGIETDIQGTSDGYLICMHDNTVDRTTNGSGYIADLTMAQIDALHIKDHDDLKVPTLEQFLSICKTYDCVPFLELKNIADDPTLIQKLADTVAEYGLEEKAIIIASMYSVGFVNIANVNIRTTFNVKPNNFNAEFAIAKAFFNTNIDMDLAYGTVTQDMIKEAHDNHMSVGVFNVNNVDDIKNYLAMGVDYVLSDFITTF